MSIQNNEYLKTKLASGKFKPKCSKTAFLVNLILDLLLVSIVSIFIYGTLNYPIIDLKLLIIFGILIPILDYIILLSPHQQYTENYFIEFNKDNISDGFKLFYRKKELTVSYKIDENGKIIFNENNKLKCFAYADGSKLSNLTKRRIINYFTSWLSDNNLISE